MKNYRVYKPFTKKAQLNAINKYKNREKKLAKDCHELWREIVFLRAGYKCEYYGCNSEATQPHHVKTKGHCNHLRYDPENGIALCYYHHKGKDGAHSDINFKDKILGRYHGFKAIRSEQWFELIERKAGIPQKLDLEMEYIYLQKTLEELRVKIRTKGNHVQ